MIDGTRFRDRVDAGQKLGRALAHRVTKADDPIVLALPRGGVPVGYEAAKALGAPLDVFIVRKLGVPGHEEYAMGAIASGGVRVLNEEALSYLPGLTAALIDAVTEREQKELERRERAYRGKRPPLDVRGRTVIIVDDGLATGSTMRAAVHALRRMGPRAIIVGVPVAAPSTSDEFRREVDAIVCVLTPDPFAAVGLWYENFDQTADEEVHELLERAAAEQVAK